MTLYVLFVTVCHYVSISYHTSRLYLCETFGKDDIGQCRHNQNVKQSVKVNYAFNENMLYNKQYLINKNQLALCYLKLGIPLDK